MPVNSDGIRTLVPTAEIKIVSGALTPTQMYTQVGAQDDTAPNDDLDTINTSGYGQLTSGGDTYRALVILYATPGDTIEVKHGTGNIDLNGGADFTLTGDAQLLLSYNGTNWTDIGISGSAVTGAAVTTALSGHSLTAATVAGTDKVLIQDTDDSDALKTVTAQSIADLAAGGGSGNVDITITAGEDLAARDNIYLNTSDNKWYKVDADAVGSIALGGLLAVATEAILTDATGTARTKGVLTGYTGLTAGSRLYAGTTAGGYTQTRPTPSSGGSQVAVLDTGYALSTTSVYIDPAPIVILKRATVADAGTLTIEHPADAGGFIREPRVLLSDTGDGVLDETYASGNQDSDVRLRERTPATYADITSGETFSADSTAGGGFEALKAFDDSNVTQWASANTSYPHWIKVDFGSDVIIRRYTATARSANFGQTPDEFELQYSSNDSDWTTIDTQTGLTWASNEKKTFTFSTIASARYWQIEGTAAQDGGNYMAFAEVELEEADTFTDDVTKLAQTFTLASETDIESVQLYLKKVGSPTGTLTLRLEDVSGSDPDGTLANSDSNATATVAESTLSASYGMVAFALPDTVTLPAGTYAIVLSSDTTASEINYVEWGADGSSPGYAGGSMRTYDGSSWAAESKDAVFAIYKEGVAFVGNCSIGMDGGDGDFHITYDDGAGADADTKTTIINQAGLSLDVTFKLEMAV